MYNVVCSHCGGIINPSEGSPLWWKARQKELEGFLDAAHCTGEECGCVEPRREPNAPIRVFGYDYDCDDFDIPFYSFTKAVRKFREFQSHGFVVFITGISDRVKHAIAA